MGLLLGGMQHKRSWRHGAQEEQASQHHSKTTCVQWSESRERSEGSEGSEESERSSSSTCVERGGVERGGEEREAVERGGAEKGGV